MTATELAEARRRLEDDIQQLREALVLLGHSRERDRELEQRRETLQRVLRELAHRE